MSSPSNSVIPAKEIPQWPPAKSLFVNGVVKLAIVAVVVAFAVGVFAAVGDKAMLNCADKPYNIVSLEVAATSARADNVLATCDRGDLVSAVAWDTFTVIPVYVLLLAGGVWFVTREKGYRLRRLAGARNLLLGAVAGVAALDLAENVVLLVGLHRENGAAALRNWTAAASATFAWPKFVLGAAVLAYIGAGVLAWVAHVPVSLSQPVEPPPDSELSSRRTGGKGISLSGGGVRAGTTGLGFLQQLDAHGMYDEANWISAVSGGSYMAGAWSIARNAPPDPDMPAGTPPPWADDSPEVDHLRNNLGYLFNRSGGAAGAVATLLVGLAVNLLVIFTMLWLVARPIGWLVGSHLIGPDLANPDGKFRVGAAQWGPVVRWAVFALALSVAWVLAQRIASLRWGFVTSKAFRNGIGAAAAAAIGITALMVIVLLALPSVTSWLPGWVSDNQAALRTGQTVAGGGVIASILGVLRNPIRKAMPRLGGLLVAALLIGVGAEFSAGAARNGWSGDRNTYLLVLAAFSVAYYIVDPDWWSLQPYYRARLRSAYATHRKGGHVAAYQPFEEPDLATLSKSPKLIVCTTLNARGGAGRPGVPAYSMTFTPGTVEVHVPSRRDGDTVTYSTNTDRYAKLFRRWDTPRLTAMTAVGMSGAAVSSAMGRFNYGSTAALLAMANVRLGMWMPNPRYTPATGSLPDRPGYPRRRINYLFKEMFQIHDPDDLYVYVTDGGHWENLGVVELIRRGCTEIFCLDASGSQTDSFGTFADAITIAHQECGATIEIDFEPLRALPENGMLSRTVKRDCALGLIRYADGHLGVLWYAKASLTESACARLLAYKEQNAIFPCDPTSDQLFDLEKFECYRILGNELSDHVLTLRDRLRTQLAWKEGDGPRPEPIEETVGLSPADLAVLSAIVSQSVVDVRNRTSV